MFIRYHKHRNNTLPLNSFLFQIKAFRQIHESTKWFPVNLKKEHMCLKFIRVLVHIFHGKLYSYLSVRGAVVFPLDFFSWVLCVCLVEYYRMSKLCLVLVNVFILLRRLFFLRCRLVLIIYELLTSGKFCIYFRISSSCRRAIYVYS